jgi:mono/diheme cytochrome c family protein
MRKHVAAAIAVCVVAFLGMAVIEGQAPGGFVAYPQRPPGDPASIDRGKILWGVNCTFCHGPDARGGDGGGPNLLRSSTMLDDQKGELIGPIVQKGRGGMRPFPCPLSRLPTLRRSFTAFPWRAARVRRH